MNLAQRIVAVSHLDPAAHAIEFEGQWVNWGATRDAIDTLQQVLSAQALGAGTRIAVLLRNRPQHVAAIAAVLGNGAILVTLNARQPDAKFLEELRALQVPLLLADTEDITEQRLAAWSALGTSVVELSAKQPPRLRRAATAALREDAPVTPPGIAVEMLTSGTTGTPKRIRFGAENLKHSILSAARVLPGAPAAVATAPAQESAIRLRRGVIINWAPALHVSGFWAVMEHLLEGRRLALLEKFEPQAWSALIARHHPRMAMLSPPTIRMILDAAIPCEALHGLEAVSSGTAPLPPAWEREFETRFGIAVLPAYGATEFPGRGAGWTLDDHARFGVSKLGSVGRPRPGVALRIVDAASGNELPSGSVGLVELKARTAAQADGTEPAWLRTTDLGELDAEGFLWIRGRADTTIIRGGFKVQPADVISVLEAHPQIREAAVVGIEDPRLGAVPVAAIVAQDAQARPAPEELAAWSREHLLPYQVPVAFRIVDALPRTPTLKISLPDVRALFSNSANAATTKLT